ncbi:MAG: RNA-binding S4 domain-containing protein [Finegoldia sp.]|nr:RNA-binding S4 domain-containing protein [Finegoldia sp.]
MRLDKFLKDSRLIKRRTVAKQACEAGRVQINGKVAKAGDEVKAGDKITVSFANSSINALVKEIIPNPKKDDAERMYELIAD